MAELWLVEQVSQKESVGTSPLDSRSRSIFATGYMTLECCWWLAKKSQTKGGRAEGVEKDWRMCLEVETGIVGGGWRGMRLANGGVYISYWNIFYWNAARPKAR